MGPTLRYRGPFVSSEVEYPYQKMMDINADLLTLPGKIYHRSWETVAHHYLLGYTLPLQSTAYLHEFVGDLKDNPILLVNARNYHKISGESDKSI